MADDDIYHFGVKGMKWGVRKQRASGYSESEYNADKAKHGTRGANRINKSVAQGHSLRKAQELEKERHRSVDGTAALLSYGGAIAGGLAGRAASTRVTNVVAMGVLPSVYKYLGNNAAMKMSSVLGSEIGQSAIRYGMTFLGGSVGSKAVNNAVLASRGYKDPKKTKK